MRKWKTGTIKIPVQGSLAGKMNYLVVRTDGKVIQVQEERILQQPCGTIEEFNSDYMKATAGLVGVTLSVESYCVDEGEGYSYAESKLKATGWREELTEVEKSAIKSQTFK